MLLHLLIVVVPCYPQVIYPTLMVLSATYCTCISLSYCPSSGCIPHYRESKEQAFSHLLGELSPISDMTVVPSIIELQGRFPGLGKVWATTVHERLRYAKQVADQIIRSRWQIRLFRV